MINFIYGTAGSGKTEQIYSRTLAAGEKGGKVILLVPEQQVLICERELAARAGAGIPLDVEVLSFRRLANTVFREEGGLRYNYLKNGEKAVLLWRTLQSIAPEMKVYGDLSLKDNSFLSEAVGCIEEFKAYRITPAQLEEAAEKISDAQSKLRDKLSDLALMYAAYNEVLSQGYSDPADDLEALLGILESSDFLCEYEFFIDSFNGYTAIELAILRLIFQKSRACTVTVGYDKSESIAFESIAADDARLRRAAQDAGKEINDVLLKDTPRYKNEELRALSAGLWDFAAPEYTGECSHIRIARTHDIYTECEFIARDIHRAVREGARYRDFAVVVRNIESYTGIIDAVFEKHSLPCYLSKRTDISLSPAVKCLLSALAIHISGWRSDDVLSYIKCGVCHLTPDEADLLENYVKAWGISGRRWHDEYPWNMNPAGYSEVVSEADGELLITLNALRERIVTPLERLFRAFSTDADVETVTRALWEFACDIGLREQVELIEDEQAGRVWNCLLGALDALVHCAGSAKVSAEVYRDLLLTVLSDADVGSIPASADEVTVGDASLLRLHGVEHVYAAGVLEGEFPRATAEGVILSDSERKTLGALGIELGAGTDMKNAEELFFFWRAVSTPRSTLTLSYPVSTLAGKSLSASIGITRVKKLFPNVPVIDCEDISPLDRVESYAGSFECAALYRGTPLGKALLDTYSLDPLYEGRIHALDLPITNTDLSLEEQTAAQLFPRDLNMSQSRLDTFAKCEFSYHCEYILKLQEERRPDFGSLDIGNFMHMLLERFMSRVCSTEPVNFDIPKKQIVELVNAIIEEYILAVFKDKSAASARLLTLIGRLRRTAVLLIESILAEFRQSEFRPAYFELPISSERDGGIAPYAVSLPDGGAVRLWGTIDRVDTYRRGDDVYVRIVDYKTGTKELSVSSIEKGQEMQMLLYLFAVWKTEDKEFLSRIGATAGHVYPAGVQYYMAKLPNLKLDRAADAESTQDLARASITRDGITLDDEGVRLAQDKSEGLIYSTKHLATLEKFGELLETVEENVRSIGTRLKSGSAAAHWNGDKNKECQYCAMRAVCRKERK